MTKPETRIIQRLLRVTSIKESFQVVQAQEIVPSCGSASPHGGWLSRLAPQLPNEFCAESPSRESGRSHLHTASPAYPGLPSSIHTEYTSRRILFELIPWSISFPGCLPIPKSPLLATRSLSIGLSSIRPSLLAYPSGLSATVILGAFLCNSGSR